MYSQQPNLAFDRSPEGANQASRGRCRIARRSQKAIQRAAARGRFRRSVPPRRIARRSGVRSGAATKGGAYVYEGRSIRERHGREFGEKPRAVSEGRRETRRASTRNNAKRYQKNTYENHFSTCKTSIAALNTTCAGPGHTIATDLANPQNQLPPGRELPKPDAFPLVGSHGDPREFLRATDPTRRNEYLVSARR